MPPDAGWQHPAGGAAGLEVGSVLYRIIRSIFEGTWDSGSSGKAINYWWGFRSDAERLDYYETLPKGTQQLLDLLEKNLAANEFPIFRRASLRRGISPRHPLQTPTPPRN